ncbi:hypothetical protein QVD17_17049 [Tagetes erecta]|uniref:Uncharacterized protein n=1 Tax=Tagetes erecta TaxID=13708 RepID=A0AAD8NTZ2_TARER|nr:hypothetical protein QVD17_17049 [Tagetes erecta]
MESPGRVEEKKASATKIPGEKVKGKKDGETKKAPVDLRHVPYPTRLMQDKYVKEFGSFLEMFKQLKINFPFIEVIQHMPKYAKFLKDLLSNRKKLESLSNVELNERLIKYPIGIVENVLVKVDKFIFPADFVILDMEADERVPLILGRSFLRTAKIIIHVFEGRITLRVGDESVTFDVMKSIRIRMPGMIEEDPEDALEEEVKMVNENVEPHVLGKERVDPFPNFLTTNKFRKFQKFLMVAGLLKMRNRPLKNHQSWSLRNYNLI